MSNSMYKEGKTISWFYTAPVRNLLKAGGKITMAQLTEDFLSYFYYGLQEDYLEITRGKKKELSEIFLRLTVSTQNKTKRSTGETV